MAEKDHFMAKVHFVAGKGGVGKTLISQALATFFAIKAKTLLVELSEEETGEERPRMATIKADVAKNLSYVRIFPDQALYEYLCLKIPSRNVLESLLSQSLFRTLCSAMPGLSDLTRLGKIWYHADESHGQKREIYEKIVVDMPSTGFVGRFLSIASVVAEAVKIGPLAKEARLIHEYFSKPNHARLHLITLPQELVVNETIELYREIKKTKGVNLGTLFINRVLKLDQEQISTFYPQAAPYPLVNRIVSSFDARGKEESAQRSRLLQAGLLLPPVVIADHMGEIVESKIIDEIITELSSEFVI